MRSDLRMSFAGLSGTADGVPLNVQSVDSTMRYSVFRRHKVTAETVEAAARVYADDPDRASNIWHRDR